MSQIGQHDRPSLLKWTIVLILSSSSISCFTGDKGLDEIRVLQIRYWLQLTFETF